MRPRQRRHAAALSVRPLKVISGKCIAGTRAFGPFKYAAFLGVMIANAMVLNQYTGQTHGTISYFTGRVVNYCIGIVLAMLASFFGPW